MLNAKSDNLLTIVIESRSIIITFLQGLNTPTPVKICVGRSSIGFVSLEKSLDFSFKKEFTQKKGDNPLNEVDNILHLIYKYGINEERTINAIFISLGSYLEKGKEFQDLFASLYNHTPVPLCEFKPHSNLDECGTSGQGIFADRQKMNQGSLGGNAQELSRK